MYIVSVWGWVRSIMSFEYIEIEDSEYLQNHIKKWRAWLYISEEKATRRSSDCVLGPTNLLFYPKVSYLKAFTITKLLEILIYQSSYETDNTDFLMNLPWVKIIAYQYITHRKFLFVNRFKHYEDELNNFIVKPDDVWVASYPKSGTTWWQEMVWLICNNFNYDMARSHSLRTRFPFLEYILSVYWMYRFNKMFFLQR